MDIRLWGWRVADISSVSPSSEQIAEPPTKSEQLLNNNKQFTPTKQVRERK